MSSKLIKEGQHLIKYLQGRNRTESAETIIQWDKVSRRLIKQCCIKGTQGFSRAQQTEHIVAFGLITPIFSWRKARFPGTESLTLLGLLATGRLWDGYSLDYVVWPSQKKERGGERISGQLLRMPKIGHQKLKIVIFLVVKRDSGLELGVVVHAWPSSREAEANTERSEVQESSSAVYIYLLRTRRLCLKNKAKTLVWVKLNMSPETPWNFSC